MTDRELLEDAARAAEIYLEWDGPPTQWQPIYYEGKTYHSWNPLTDDGDRYRLARKCKLIVDFDGGRVRWQFDGEEYKRAFKFTPGNGEEEAYAIVRAAAEIGRSMK